MAVDLRGFYLKVSRIHRQCARREQICSEKQRPGALLALLSAHATQSKPAVSLSYKWAISGCYTVRDVTMGAAGTILCGEG